MVSLVISGYTPDFSYFLIRVYLLIKGIVASFLIYGSLPLFQEFNVDANTYQRYVCLGLIPWALKPIVGVISDTYSIAGWHKKYYVIGAVCLGMFCSTFVSFSKSQTLSAGMLFGVSFSIMVIDLLVESTYSMLIAYNNKSRAVISYVWAYIMLGTSIGAVVIGPMADNKQVEYVFLLAVIMFGQLLAPLLKRPYTVLPNDLVISPNSSEMLIERENSVGKKKPGISEWSLSLVLVVASTIVISSLFGASDHPWAVVYLGLATMGVLMLWVVIQYYQLKPYWACCVYMSLVEILYIDISGAQDYFYTAGSLCNPDGPQFSYTFYITLGVCVGGVCGSVGSLLYKEALGTWNMRSCIQLGLLLRSLCALVDISIAKRWNIDYGISDKVAFLLGDAVLGPMISMFLFIPMFTMMSYLVQPGRETFTFAILAGFQNLGQVVSKIIGIAFSQSFNVVAQSNSPTCNFEYYPALILFAHMIFPLLCVPLGYILIPETKST